MQQQGRSLTSTREERQEQRQEERKALRSSLRQEVRKDGVEDVEDGSYVVYAPDPTGWAVAFYGTSTAAPANVPSYKSSCSSDIDGCLGQGYCDDH